MLDGIIVNKGINVKTMGQKMRRGALNRPPMSCRELKRVAAGIPLVDP